MKMKNKKFRFNYFDHLDLHIYEFRSEPRFINHWKGFFSDKWRTEYYEITKYNESFFIKPFAGMELALFPSIALKFLGTKNLFATIMFDKFGFAVDEFAATDTYRSNWFVTADMHGAEIKRVEGTIYHKIKGYKDIIKLQDCSDATLELFFLKAKVGFEKAAVSLIENKSIDQLFELKEVVDLMVITTNSFDVYDDSVVILSFNKIDEKVKQLEAVINQAINRYEKAILSDNDAESFLKSARHLMLHEK